MGALSPKRGSSPCKLTDSRSFLSLVLIGCRTIILLSLAGILGIYALRFFTVEPPKESPSYIGKYLVDGVGHVTNVEVGGKHQKLFLGAVIFNRVFKQDKFNITAYECRQWIEYMLFAGVEHIFWYDTAHSDEESQEMYLMDYVKKGVLTYHRFHQLFPGYLDAGLRFEQDHSYEHFLEKLGDENFLADYADGRIWAVEMDVDEYPFMPSDTKKAFLRRYVEDLQISRPDVTQILMQCMIFGGNPKGDLTDGWVIERYQRRKRAADGLRNGFASRTKPMFQPRQARGISDADPHQFPMKSGGNTLVARPEVLRMNHYWGPRLSDFKPDSPTVLGLLVEDDSAQVIAAELKGSTGLTKKTVCLQKKIFF